MSTTKIIIPFADNKGKSLAALFNVLISFKQLSMQEVPDQVTAFQEGHDLSFDILTELLPELFWNLQDEGFSVKPYGLQSLIRQVSLKRHVYTAYRVLKTSWGIAINITGTLEEINAEENKITVSIKDPGVRGKDLVEAGLKSLFPVLAGTHKKYNILIQEVEFNPSHFQLEGLYWGARHWLSQALKIEIPDPEISYDKALNKYVFHLKQE